MLLLSSADFFIADFIVSNWTAESMSQQIANPTTIVILLVLAYILT